MTCDCPPPLSPYEAALLLQMLVTATRQGHDDREKALKETIAKALTGQVINGVLAQCPACFLFTQQTTFAGLCHDCVTKTGA